jgi:hypothetical protein
MGTAADWFATEREFRQLCGDAVSLAKQESAEEFAAEMVKKANEHGLFTYLSQKQLNWLCQIADWQVPERRKP